MTSDAPAGGPTLSRIQRGLACSASVCYVAGLGLTPWLVAPVNTLFALGFLLWFLGGRAGVSLRELAGEPLVRVFVVGFVLLALAALVSPLPRGQATQALLQYRELLFSVPMVALFRDPAWRARALLVFCLSAFLLVLVSTALWLGLATSPRGPAEGALVLRHQITHATVVGTLALLAWLQSGHARSPGRQWLWRVVSLWSAANVLLMVPGRTGYLIVAVGLLYLGFRRWRLRGALLAIMAALAVGVLAYMGSDMLRARVDAVSVEAKRFTEGQVEPTSVGSRLLFWRSSVELIGKHPWFGTGLGTWRSQIAEVMSPEQREKVLMGNEHPHNEFIHVAVQTGLLGATIYLAGLIVLARRALRLVRDDRQRGELLVASLLIYFVGSLVNVYLWVSVEGQLFTALSALAVAGGGAARIGSHSGMSR